MANTPDAKSAAIVPSASMQSRMRAMSVTARDDHHAAEGGQKVAIG